jgi:hypothetical protein
MINAPKSVRIVVVIAVLTCLGSSTPARAGNGRHSRPDHKAPRVSLTAPRTQATVSGTISVDAVAWDRRSGVAGVRFELDGTDLGAEDTTSPYSTSWDTTTASDGTHVLTATARDAAGNQATAAIAVEVANSASGSDGTAPADATMTPGPDPGVSTPDSTGERFVTLPPGSPLPSDAECAARVRRSSFEPRPENLIPNNTNVYVQGVRLSGSELAPYGYEEKVTGNFTGTTDEILQWAACKWGIDEDIVRAQAVQESYWRQSALGDCRGGTVPDTDGCQSVGILQVKGADIPPTHPGTWPYAYVSTAFNADYTYGIWRACYEGKETWLGNGYRAGDAWGCVGRWFSGDWYRSSQDYISRVQTILNDEVWLDPDF